MKIRVMSLLLAVLMAASLVPAAAASAGNDTTALDGTGSADFTGAVSAGSPFLLDGTALNGLEYQVCCDTYYVTVESFAAAVDREVVVEQEKGVLVATAAVAGLQINEFYNGIFVPAGGAASMEAETLDLMTYVGAYFVEANDRVLYVENGVTTVNGKVALPVRVLAKVFNLDVAFDAKSGTVALTRQEGADRYLEDGDTYYDGDMLYWMSRIIYSESGNQPLRGKIAVGNVVLNRIEDPSFPDNIYDVLFQKNQFSPAMSGSIYRTPNAASVRAAKMVLDGAEVLEDVLFFNRKGMNTRAARNRTFVATIGGHSFYA